MKTPQNFTDLELKSYKAAMSMIDWAMSNGKNEVLVDLSLMHPIVDQFLTASGFKTAIHRGANGVDCLISWVSDTRINALNPAEMIKSHERSVEILEAIQSFKHKKKFIVECSIGGFAGTFPRLRAKYENDVDTINRCIMKLYNKYLNLCHW